jgi:DNA-binding HxlR family transcriptional regulator
MDDEGERVTHLEQQLEAVLRRLEALETEPVEPMPAEPAERPAERSAGEGTVQGTLAYSGVLRSGGQRYKIQREEDLSKALQVDPVPVARAFAALGSPFRILLLRALLQGPRTSQELQTELDVGPVGQLYHHLKELLAAGLVVQRKRSVYAIREDKVLPVCMVVVAALRLVLDQPAVPQGAHTTEEADQDEPDQGEGEDA